MVEKFQLLQTAHEVLSDPQKRATYDQTRKATGRATAAYTRQATSPPTTKNRYSKPSARPNGFSRGTPQSTKPAFGYFTTREPPTSTRKPTGPTPAGFTGKTRATPRKSPEKDRADAYFGRFREKTTAWQQFSATASSSSTPHAKAQQRKEEAQRAAGVRPAERKKPNQTRFGTTFDEEKEEPEEEESEEDTFYSFSSNGGTFNGTERKGQPWSERRSAYSHVFYGAKEDLRSPLKTNTQKPSTENSEGFTSADSSSNQNGFASDGFKQQCRNEPTSNAFSGGFAKETEKKSDAPPIFSSNGPARRKSSQQSTPTPANESTEFPPTNPNEIPKTPPPVEERLFASAFSRLNVNSGTKRPPPKSSNPVDIEDWTKRFEGMNPFMTPGTKKLSEDKNFWSSAPLRGTPASSRPRAGRARAKRGGLDDMGDLKRELPKANGGFKFQGPDILPVFANFNTEVTPTHSPEPTSPVKGAPQNLGARNSSVDPTTPTRAPQQPIPASTAFHPLSPAFQSSSQPVFQPPELHRPTPPERLIPCPSNLQEFVFSVPSMAEMQSLAQQVQAYHSAYVAERTRFEEAWKKYETEIQFHFPNEHNVRIYLEAKERFIEQRAEMEMLHTLCLERWESVAKFSGFAG